MGMFEIDKVRKHFVPQFYLRGFHVPNNVEHIYVFDKSSEGPEITERAIHDVEVSRDAYSVANDIILTEREGCWAPILAALRQTDLNDLNELIADREGSAGLRSWLARFVIDSKLRSHGFRKQMSESLTQLRVEHLQMHEATKAEFLGQSPESANELEALFSLLRDKSGLDNPRKYPALMTDPFLRGEEGEELYRCYEEGSWRFDGPQSGRNFITSDIPSTSFRLGPQHPNWIWFSMPLSAELLLTGLCGDARVESGLAPREGAMDGRAVSIVNDTVFRHSEQFIYSSSMDEITRTLQGMGQ